MSDSQKTKAQLAQELQQLRQSFAALENEHEQVKKTLGSERERLLEEITTRQKRLVDQVEATQEVTAQTNMNDITQAIVKTLVERWDAALARIWLLEGTFLTLTASAGLSTRLDGERSRVAMDEQYKLGQIALAQRPRFSTDLPNDQEIKDRAWVQREGLQTFAGFPLFYGDQLLGVLAMFSQKRFDATDFELLSTYIQQIGIIIENARLSEQTQATLAEARQSEQLLRSVIDATPDLIFIKDQEHRYRLVNQGYAGALHLQPADFIGKDDLDLDLPAELVKGDPDKGLKGSWATDRQVMDSGKPLTIPRDRVTIDDELRVFHTIKTPLRGAEGHVWGVLSFARDVTEREQMLYSIIDATPDWVFIKDQEYRYQLVNQSYANALNLTPSDFIGRNDLDLGFSEELVKGDPAKGIRGFWSDDRQVMDSGEPLIIPRETVTLGDQAFVFNTIKAPLRDAEGNVWGVLAFARDVAQRESLLDATQRQSTQLQTAAQVSRAANSILDPDELIQQVVGLVRQQFGLYYVGLFLTDPSGQWATLRSGTGEAGRQMVAQGHKLEIGGASTIGSCIANVEARIALDVGEEAVRFDNPYLPQTRSEMALPLVARGQAIGAITVQSVEEAAFSSQDITALQSMADQVANAIENARLFEQVQATLAEARQSEHLLRSIIDATPDLIFVKDPAHNFQLVNRSFASSLGLQPEDFIGKNDIDVGFPEERVKGDPEKGIRGFWEDDDHVIYSGEELLSPRDTVVLHGQARIMNFAKMALRDAQGDIWGLLGIGRDVTEREQLFADLERRGQDLQTASEVSSAISSILDPDELNQQVVDLVQERFGLYYAGLFLVDQSGEWSGEPNKWAVLRAGSGQAGRQMMKQRHKLEIGGASMIGSCIAEAQARIALDVGEEARRFDNPHLPNTRSEMALPLVTRGQTIGAMTIQSEKEAAFSGDDIAVLQTMADQVATAIQNGRLYQESIILYMASQAISQAETVEDALAGAARYIIGSIYDTCALLTFVQAGQQDSLEVLAAWEKRPGAGALAAGTVLSQRRFPMYNTIARQETLIFNDLLQDEHISAELAQRMQADNVRSSLSIPLTVGADWLGILLAQSSHATALGPEGRRAFEPLAHQLAAFIQSARRLAETQQALEEVQRLHRSYISEAWQDYLSSAKDTMVADYLLEQQQIIPRPQLDIPEIARALEQNRVIVGGQRAFSQPDSTQAIMPGGGEEHSVIVAPISLREQVIGTLGIHDPSGQHTWDEDDIALLEAVSIQLGLAIDNARLAEQTQTSLAETQTLFDTSRNLAAAQGIDEIQQAVVEAARSRRVDACALLMFDTLERETASDLVLVAAWDSQETPRLPAGVRLPLATFELFDNLQSDQPYAVPNLAQADVDVGTRNLMTSLGFAALLHQPIAAHDRWFGLLTVLHAAPHDFGRAEINFYRTLADQAALAIEGQRLLTETQQRAEREQLIRQVTEKVHDTPDMETILRTTVQELSKAMGLPRVFVRLGTKETLSRPPAGSQTE